MNRLLSSALLALAFTVAIPTLAQAAPPMARAYAPENLRTLSRDDQARVIGIEYSEQSNGRAIPDDQLRFYLDQVNRSNWNFSRVKQDIAKSLDNNDSGGNYPQPPIGNGNTIRCDSNSNDARTCRTPWRGSSRLVRQVSSSACVEGRSWNSQNGEITVWSGCRGEFAPRAQIQPPIGGDNVMRCESTDNRSRTCRTPWQGGSRLNRQLSKTACVQGRTWQSQNGQVSVSGGCRGEFTPDRYGQPNYPQTSYPGQWNGNSPGNGYSVTCSSTGKHPQSCAWNGSQGRPVVQKQISTSRCRENDTWWYDGSAIWVKNGCRALFGTR